MRTITALLLTLTLAACAGARTFDSDMQARYVGQPVATALQDFGTPKGSFTAADGGTAYVWQKRDSESIFGPVVTKGAGYDLAGIYWQGVTYNRCVIRANVKNGTVSAIRFEGEPGACEVITGYRKKDLGRKRDTQAAY